MNIYLSQGLDPLPTTILFILPLLFLYAIVSRLRRKPPLPPGPKGLPIIGNMLTMDHFTLTNRGLANLAKKYGDMFHMKMGSVHMVAITSPEIAKQVLQVQDNVFSDRPTSKATRYLSYNRADLAFADYGPFWRQMRKLCVMRLFSRKRAESWNSVRDEVESMVKAVASNAGKPVNIGELIFTLTMNIIYRAAFGSINERKEEFLEIIQEFNKLFVSFNISDFIPWLGWFDPNDLNNKLAKARDSLDKFIDKIIDDHVQKRTKIDGSDGGTIHDMVDEMLTFYGDDEVNVKESDDLQSSIKLTKENMKAIIMDVMFGGVETVASIIEWALAELIKSPDDLKRIQQELTEVVGLNRQVEEAHLEKLTFLKFALKETLRLHPPIPVTHHATCKDAEVAGYCIPAKTRVIINIWALMRDPNYWDDPETFRPSRFLKDGAPDFRGNNFEFIPFGSGRRSCPGMNLGLYGLEMAVAHLLHGFQWELPDGMKPSELDMSESFGLTAQRAIRLVAIPSPRLECPLA
uniref:Cytochrome P450 84A127 n=1 Tax=Tripterygium wilfordii TaxID=458696 RepID=A0A8T8L905_TRIWF|nr:cytochrome P450 84A127 [Tripterygium wilfordii]